MNALQGVPPKFPDSTSILSVESIVYRPNTPRLAFFPIVGFFKKRSKRRKGREREGGGRRRRERICLYHDISEGNHWVEVGRTGSEVKLGRWSCAVHSQISLDDLRALKNRFTRPVFWRTFHRSRILLLAGSLIQRAHPLPATSPFQSLFPRITDGNGQGAATFPALFGVTVDWDRLMCGGVRPAGDPVDSDPEPSSRTTPTLDRTLVATCGVRLVSGAHAGARRSCPGSYRETCRSFREVRGDLKEKCWKIWPIGEKKREKRENLEDTSLACYERTREKGRLGAASRIGEGLSSPYLNVAKGRNNELQLGRCTVLFFSHVGQPTKHLCVTLLRLTWPRLWSRTTPTDRTQFSPLSPTTSKIRQDNLSSKIHAKTSFSAKMTIWCDQQRVRCFKKCLQHTQGFQCSFK